MRHQLSDHKVCSSDNPFINRSINKSINRSIIDQATEQLSYIIPINQ